MRIPSVTKAQTTIKPERLLLVRSNLDLIDTQSVHPGHEAGERGLPSAADADQEQVTLRLTEDSEGEHRLHLAMCAQAVKAAQVYLEYIVWVTIDPVMPKIIRILRS